MARTHARYSSGVNQRKSCGAARADDRRLEISRQKDGWKMLRRVLFVIWIWLTGTSLSPFLAAQQTPPCRGLLAAFPASLVQLDSLTGAFARFEMHRCGSGNIQIHAFEKGAAGPSFVFDTGDDYPAYLVHVSNVLVLQSGGGSCDHVYVFIFVKGKPRLALQSATKDQVQVRRIAGDKVEVEVPVVTYPDHTGKFPPAPIRRYLYPYEP